MLTTDFLPLGGHVDRIAFTGVGSPHFSSLVGRFRLDRARAFFDETLDLLTVLGECNGIEAIPSQLEIDKLRVKSEDKSLVTDGETVMLERVDNSSIGDKAFSMEVMAAFEANADGRIRRWRESYDLKSMTDQIEAAAFKVPT